MDKLERVIEGLEKLREYADNEVHPVVSPDNWSVYSGLIDLIDEIEEDTLALLKDSGQDEGWLCEKRTSGWQKNDLLCACGNKVYFTTLLFRGGFTANELYCPNCGLSMRSPGQDKDGVWLKKHWEEVVLKAQQPRVITLEELDYLRGRGRAVWFEDRDAFAKCQDVFFVVASGIHAYFKGETYSMLKMVDGYGKSWRCWTSRPDEKTRVETPWDSWVRNE